MRNYVVQHADAQVAVGVYDFLNPANFANDNRSATFSTTAYGTDQWWRVDFARCVTVQTVRLLFAVFASDMLYVHVGDANTNAANVICASVAANTSSTAWATATCVAPLTGRYLHVRNSMSGRDVQDRVWPL